MTSVEQSAGVDVTRLGIDDVDVVILTFALMTDVFETPADVLTETYASELLGRAEFWALAAVVDDRVVGGLTAHELPMTTLAAERGNDATFVLADNGDEHALAFYRALVRELRDVTMFDLPPG